ncbi:MAG TPA: thiopeptide-type bacteriocin biosynthesis protein, partial [Umezawaea sp.]|nr:thiopeptide-type bacteriocin biosynthesis protein [Umezawaea sp.]
MSADRLTLPQPDRIVDGVLAVLAGADLTMIAARTMMDPADLADALEVYQDAGRAALQQRAERDWYQVRVRFPAWEAAETIGAQRLGPCLDRLQADGAMTGWWFLRKHPCWRVRFHNADTATVNDVLTELTATGVIDRWWPTIYEPESAAFGGHDGMTIAHTLFCQDARGVLDYARQDSPGLGRRELSLLLLNELLRSAGLDTFERGDVFAQVAALRPTPAPGDQNKIEDLAAKVTIPLSIPRVADSSLFAANGPIAHAAPWLEAFRTAGHCLGEAAAQGLLDRGIRAILTHV